MASTSLGLGKQQGEQSNLGRLVDQLLDVVFAEASVARVVDGPEERHGLGLADRHHAHGLRRAPGPRRRLVRARQHRPERQRGALRRGHGRHLRLRRGRPRQSALRSGQRRRRGGRWAPPQSSPIPLPLPSSSARQSDNFRENSILLLQQFTLCFTPGTKSQFDLLPEKFKLLKCTLY
jgi:hypothetical protein